MWALAYIFSALWVFTDSWKLCKKVPLSVLGACRFYFGRIHEALAKAQNTRRALAFRPHWYVARLRMPFFTFSHGRRIYNRDGRENLEEKILYGPSADTAPPQRILQIAPPRQEGDCANRCQTLRARPSQNWWRSLRFAKNAQRRCPHFRDHRYGPNLRGLSRYLLSVAR